MTSASEPVRQQPPLGHVPGLDVLRALAVSAVIFGHSMPQYIHGGTVGVDVFFVLSGFLITRILKAELDRNGALDLRTFYIRRLLRLSPALWIMVAGYVIACVIATAVGRGPGLLNVASASAAALTYVMNWTRAYHIGAEAGLGHTWSLAVEEQFYLLWPLLLGGFFRWAPRRLLPLTAFLCASSFALNYAMLARDVDFFRIYNGFDTRAAELLVGCMLGLIDLRRLPSALLRAWWAPAAFLLFCLLGTEAQLGPIYELGLPVIDVCAAWIIASIVVLGSRTRGIMTNPAGVFIGRISYGMYLWHWPLALALQGSLPPVVVFVIVYGAALLLAFLSYLLVESRVMRLRDRWTSKQAVAA